MFIEAFVFGSDEGVDDIGRDILEFDVAAVAFVFVIFSHGGTVFGEDLGCERDRRILQLLQRRKCAENAQVDQDEEEDEASQAIEKGSPENTDGIGRHIWISCDLSDVKIS